MCRTASGAQFLLDSTAAADTIAAIFLAIKHENGVSTSKTINPFSDYCRTLLFSLVVQHYIFHTILLCGSIFGSANIFPTSVPSARTYTHARVWFTDFIRVSSNWFVRVYKTRDIWQYYLPKDVYATWRISFLTEKKKNDTQRK